MRLSGLGALLALVVVAASEAQTIRGTVTLRAEARPAAGVVVLMLDSAGATVSRALTNEAGEFAVRASRAGAYRVRTLRIGFRPEVSAAIRLAVGEDTFLPITLAGIPVALDTVRVSSRNSCSASGDSALATHAIWEQMRTAFTAAQLTAQNADLAATLMTYERALDPTFPRVRRQSVAFQHALSGRPWRTTSADSLRRFGYVVPDLLGGKVFRAPDLEVLLSNTFREDHCFRLARGSNAERLGIEFEPTRDRGNIAEVSGTVWLKRATAELQSLDFRYVGLSTSETNGRPGGEMDFLRLPSGAWAIERWNIRMPVLETVTERGTNIRGAVREVERVTEIRVMGGELVSVMRGEDTLWARPTQVFSARLQDSVLKRAVSGARVQLRGTSVSGTTDRSGKVSFAGVLAGQYGVDIRTEELDIVGAVHQTTVDLADPSREVTVLVPDANRVVANYCGFKLPTTPLLGAALGTVRIEGDSTPPWNAHVVAEWKSGNALRSADARTDAMGRYRICGIPVNAEFTLRTELDDTATVPRPSSFSRSSRYARTDIVIARPATIAGTMFAGAVLTLFGSEPIAEAEIALPDLGISARTNEYGRFRLSGIPPGTHRVAVRRIGYGALEQSVTFVQGRASSRQFRMVQVATLEPVTVTADRRLLHFEENRRLGLGKFVTRAELARQEYRPLSVIVASVSGTDIFNLGSKAFLRSSRYPRAYGPALAPNRDNIYCIPGTAVCQCWSQVYINGMLVNPGRPTPAFDLNTWGPYEIEAIEYYASMSALPTEYANRGSTCGVFVIHMRITPHEKPGQNQRPP